MSTPTTVTAASPTSDITYSILLNDDPDLDLTEAVAIDPATGELTVTDPTDFDFEGTDPCRSPSRPTTVSIPQRNSRCDAHRSDVPVFTDVGPVAVDENSAVSTVIGDINANDGTAARTTQASPIRSRVRRRPGR